MSDSEGASDSEGVMVRVQYETEKYIGAVHRYCTYLHS